MARRGDLSTVLVGGGLIAVGAAMGAFGPSAKDWVGKYLRLDFNAAGLKSGASGGGSAPAPSIPASRAAAAQASGDDTDPFAVFARISGLDVTDRNAAWVRYYHDQFQSWPEDDLRSGNAEPYSLASYAASAIGYLQSIGAA